MQHSQIRKPNERVKLFAKASSQQTKSITVYEFVNGALQDITPITTIEDLNTGYFSTEIITPDHSSYLLIMFCGNPIVLRIGEPSLEFFFWAPKQKTYSFKHFDEFGTKLDEGILNPIGVGFYYHTPISDTLGYIEVLNRPYIIHVPYCSGSVGVGIDIDWKRTIKRQVFGADVINSNFELNTKKNFTFNLGTHNYNFSLLTSERNFSMKVDTLEFKVFCRK